MTTHTEKRWALKGEFKGFGWSFLGRYCWQPASEDEPQIRTFATREQAREAKKRCGHPLARVVRVVVTVEELA